MRDGFVLRDGQRTDMTARLNAAGLPAVSSVAADITDAGDVVGSATRADGTRFGYVITGGAVISLDRRTVTCCAQVRPGALNSALQISSDGGVDQFTAKVWEPVKVFDETSPALVYAGHWTRHASSGAWLGHVSTSTQAGDSVSLSFTGRRVWWIAPMGAGGGIARVFVDGSLAATVDLSVSRRHPSPPDRVPAVVAGGRAAHDQGRRRDAGAEGRHRRVRGVGALSGRPAGC